MSLDKNKGKVVKKSNDQSSPKLLQALRKIMVNGGGSVSYVFVSNRFKRKNFVNKEGKLDFVLEPEQIKSVQHVSISAQALEGNKPGTLKSPQDLIEMFQTTKWDLGADYFILD